MGGLTSLAKKDWMNTRLRLTHTNHVICVSKKKSENLVDNPKIYYGAKMEKFHFIPKLK